MTSKVGRQDIIDMAVQAGIHISPNGAVHANVDELETMICIAVQKESQARIQCQTDFMHYQNEMQARGVREIKAAYERGVRDATRIAAQECDMYALNALSKIDGDQNSLDAIFLKHHSVAAKAIEELIIARGGRP